MIVRFRNIISWQNIANKIFVINEESGMGICLEESGVDFWLELLKENRFEKILNNLSEIYELNEEEIRADFLELLNQLMSMGIVEIIEENLVVK